MQYASIRQDFRFGFVEHFLRFLPRRRDPLCGEPSGRLKCFGVFFNVTLKLLCVPVQKRLHLFQISANRLFK
jgi:hypothetical protein